uniref:Intraflagellar transport protein 22 homolog n=1 Tax=Micrurus surinamensis TaxID=129470 RepID=A0A2D4NQD6_MICSU
MRNHISMETAKDQDVGLNYGIVEVIKNLPSHVKEIEMWYSCFVQQQQLLENQCLLIAHHKPGTAGDVENLTLPSPLNRLTLIHSSLEEDPEDVQMEFVKFLKNITNLVNENRDREEMLIIN